jgi:hypothetical protein
MSLKRAILLFLFVLMLASCSVVAPAPPAPTPTPVVIIVTATAPPASPTSPATQTPYVITATPLPATATSVPTNTPIPTNTPAPTNTPIPTATAVPPTPTNVPPTAVPSPTPGFKYLPPIITTKANNITLYPGDIVIAWDFPQELASDEYFQVIGWKEIKPERNALTWTQARSWRFVVNSGNINMFPWISGLGQYYMAVQVIRGKDGKFAGELSRESAPWPWRW